MKTKFSRAHAVSPSSAAAGKSSRIQEAEVAPRHSFLLLRVVEEQFIQRCLVFDF